jgi:hypothetical protein
MQRPRPQLPCHESSIADILDKDIVSSRIGSNFEDPFQDHERFVNGDFAVVGCCRFSARPSWARWTVEMGKLEW